MTTKLSKGLFLTLLFLMFVNIDSLLAANITITMPTSTTSYRTLAVGNTYKIYDNGGSSGNYSNNCNGILKLTAPSGYKISFSGSYRTEDNYDYLKIYNSNSASSSYLLGSYCGTGSVNVSTTSIYATITFTSDRSTVRSGFEITATLVPISSGGGSTGGGSGTGGGSSTGDSSNYYGCINYANLNSSSVDCRYGTFYNPAQYMGVNTGRHTVISQNGFDPRTGNGLKLIPDGYSCSVKLGNEQTGAEAERITYSYHVDTSVYDMLIMKYAAVLEDPGHTSVEQPRFSFRILNAQGVEINHNCYSADFISNPNLGWNQTMNGNRRCYWKDWTTVAVDLDQLHGQTIKIQLTTYDCEQSGHYGYAYFVFSCGNKFISSTSCGSNVSNTFTAPEGFTYKWRRDGSSQTISTNRSINVAQAGTYYCDMSFVGASNSQCGFTLSAIAGERYPYSRFTYNFTDVHQCQRNVRFTNQSVVSRNEAHTDLTNERCESYQWFFGDGTSSTEMNPTHYYDPGTYQVRLIAKLGNGSCQDTSIQTIHISDPCQVYDTVSVTLCPGQTYQFFDTVLSTPGTYTRDSVHLRRTLTLNYYPNTSSTVSDTVVANALPVVFNGVTFTDSATDTIVTITNSYGCDSLIHYTLTVFWNDSVNVDSTICENDLPITWNSRVFSGPGTQTDTLLNAHLADSVVVMNLFVNYNTYDTVSQTMIENNLPATYAGASFNTDVNDTTIIIANSHGCDSLINYSLLIHWNESVTVDSTICENSLPLSWNSRTFTAPGTQLDTLLNRFGADSVVTMNLTVLYNTYDTVSQTIIENNLPASYAGETFLRDVNDTTIILTNALGCDSLINYSLLVYWNEYVSVDSSICENSLPLIWNSRTFTAPGTQLDTLLNRFGADSVVTMNLSVRYNTYDTVSQTIIENNLPATYAGETFLTDVTDTTIILTNALGCDSLINYSLLIHWNESVTVDSTICENSLPLSWNSRTFTAPGTQLDTLLNRFGADSVVTMNLTVLHNTFDTVSQTIIENNLPATYAGGTFLTDVNDTTIILTNALGCDSLINYSLLVYRNVAVSVDSTICENSLPFTWNSRTFTVPGTQLDTLLNRFGADSVVTMNLTVHYNTYDTVSQTIIENNLPATYAGVLFNTDVADTTIILTNAIGCDSLINYTLQVYRNVTVNVDSTICDNFLPIVWNGISFTQAGTQQAVLTGNHGIDSTVIMTLHVNPTFSVDHFAEICDGNSYEFKGQDYNQAGDYSVSAFTQFGCDSLVNLHLTVWPVYQQDFLVEICDGAQHHQSGADYDSAGIFNIALQTIHGCDSLETLYLTVHPVYETTVELTGCINSFVEMNGVKYWTDGLYQQELASIHGCDSLLNIEVDMRDVAKAFACSDPRVCDLEHEKIHFKDQSRNAVRRTWYIGDEIVSTEKEFDFNYPAELQDDTLWVKMVAYNGSECDDSTLIFITYLREFIYAPNIFFPDQSENNKFYLGHDNIHDGHVWIYTRRGQFVYDFDIMTGFWDGRLDGNLLPQGTYTWVCKYHSNDNPRQTQQKVGTITLIR